MDFFLNWILIIATPRNTQLPFVLKHASNHHQPGKTAPREPFFAGPKGSIKIKYREKSARVDPFAFVFVEKFEVKKKLLRIKGWTHCPECKLESIEFSGGWKSRVSNCTTGINRPDVAESLGLPEAGKAGFQCSLALPLFCHRLRIRFHFSGGKTMELSPAGKFHHRLRNRFVRNIGLRYFMWARPLKWKLGFGGQPAPALENTTPAEPGNLAFHYAGYRNGDVVLPVYNGIEFLIKLIPPLVQDPEVSRLIIVDDCSSDPAVGEFLGKVAEACPKVVLIRNPENLGFLKSANIGMREVKQDFVLLNSDVEVPPNWVGRLLEPIRRDSSIASATPFSNAATILSFPFCGENNRCFDDIEVQKIDEQFKNLRPRWPLPELPTGVGFCMGMSKAVLDQIGGFDEVFGRGYGEENDWCQRARAAGFKSVAVPNLYVHHFHGGSFQAEEKNELLQRNLRILGERFPAYHAEVQEFLKEDPLATYRNLAVLDVMSNLCGEKGVALVFDHCEGGGANSFGDQMVEGLARAGGVVLIVLPDRTTGTHTLALIHLRLQIKFTVRDDEELWRLLAACPVTQIEVNSLMFFHDAIDTVRRIREFAQARPVSLRVFLHDYHCLCPSHNLINSEGKYCGLPEMSVCQQCLSSNCYADDAKGLERTHWIEAWAELFRVSTEIRTFSTASAELFLRTYHEFKNRVKMIPHAKSSLPGKIGPVDFSNPPVIGVIGNIGHPKGARVIEQLGKLGAYRIVILGDFSEKENPPANIVCHGPYEKKELPGLIEQYGINLGFVPSIWPETFNFVTDELISIGLPLIAFDIGAHAERIEAYQLGRVLPLEYSENPHDLAVAIQAAWYSLSGTPCVSA